MCVSKLSPEEEQEILTGSPTGTFALLLAFAAVFIAAWLLLYFGRYMSIGPIS
jgi:hypothetical protein